MRVNVKPNALIWLALSALVIALDQVTKYFAIELLEPYEAHAVIPGFLNWTLAYNAGAAFSFLHDAGGWQRWLFTVLAIAVILTVVSGLQILRHGYVDWQRTE